MRPQHLGDALLRGGMPVEPAGGVDCQRPKHVTEAQRGGERNGLQELGQVRVEIAATAQMRRPRNGCAPQRAQSGQQTGQLALEARIGAREALGGATTGSTP